MIVAHTYTHLMLIDLPRYRVIVGVKTGLALLKAGIGRDHGHYAYIWSLLAHDLQRYLLLLYSVVK